MPEGLLHVNSRFQPTLRSLGRHIVPSSLAVSLSLKQRCKPSLCGLNPHPPSQILSMHGKENPICVFLFWELRGLSPNFYIMCL